MTGGYVSITCLEDCRQPTPIKLNAVRGNPSPLESTVDLSAFANITLAMWGQPKDGPRNTHPSTADCLKPVNERVPMVSSPVPD